MSESNGATAVAEAPNPTQADTQATQGADSDREEADALLADLSTATEADKGTGTEGEGNETPSEDEESDPVLEARAAELAEKQVQELTAKQETERKAKEEKDRRKAETEGVDNAFRTRTQAIRDFLGGRVGTTDGFKLDAPLPQEAINAITALFENHHAQSSPVATRQMQRELIAAGGLEEHEWESPEAFVAAIKEAAKGELTQGMVSEAQAKRREADAALRTKRFYQKNPERLTSQTQSAADRQGGGAAGGLTIQVLRNATPEQYEQLKVKYGSEAISRVYMQAANQ